MARRRTTNRDHNNIASDPLDSFLTPVVRPKHVTNATPTTTQYLPKSLRQIEDRRTWHPDGAQKRPPATVHSSKAKLAVAPPQKNKRILPHRIAFQAPKSVLVCIRRKMRAEVLHALKRTRRGSGSPKHRTAFSDIKC